ncbi:helix-turn-helix domain-containing protein [Azospirillum largimobile]
MPLKVRRSIRKLGRDIGIARRKRRLTMEMMAERSDISVATYQRVEKGDPSVAFGIYAMALFALGAGDRIASLMDVVSDDTGLLLDEERLPKRVRVKRTEGGAL